LDILVVSSSGISILLKDSKIRRTYSLEVDIFKITPIRKPDDLIKILESNFLTKSVIPSVVD
jgi:hypothetical protein